MSFERRNHGAGHSYRLDGAKVPGVTTILKALPKDALVNWAATQAADLAVNDWDRLAALPISARHKEIAGAHRRAKTKAAVRGTRIHKLGEALAHGREVQVPDDLAGPVGAYARWLDRWDVTAEHVEGVVGSRRHVYAGTLDLIATIGVRGGARALLDVKAGRGVYGETALQLAAYRYADVLCDPDSGAEIAMPEVDAVWVAHVLPDDVEMLPVAAGRAEFRTFLYLRQVWAWLEAAKEDRPIGDAAIPELAEALS